MKTLFSIDIIDEEKQTVCVQSNVDTGEELETLACTLASFLYNNDPLCLLVESALTMLVSDTKAQDILEKSTITIKNKNFN